LRRSDFIAENTQETLRTRRNAEEDVFFLFSEVVSAQR
jgi:hypothetical protein